MKDLLNGISLIHKAKPGGINPVKEEKNTSKFAFASVVSNKDLDEGEILTKKIFGLEDQEMEILVLKNFIH